MNNLLTIGLVANSKRTLLSGSKFDSMIPFETGKEISFGEAEKTENIVQSMAVIIKKTLPETKKIADLLYSENIEENLKNIWNFVYNHVQYNHIQDIQLLKSPSYLWHNRSKGGNCADYTIFITSILINQGFNPEIKIAAYGKGYQHVYPVLKINNNKYIIDCVVDSFNYEHKPISMQKYFKMRELGIPVYGLMGVNPVGAIESVEMNIKEFIYMPDGTWIIFEQPINTNRKFNTNNDKFKIGGTPDSFFDGEYTLEPTLVKKFGDGGRTLTNSVGGNRKLEELTGVFVKKVMPLTYPFVDKTEYSKTKDLVLNTGETKEVIDYAKSIGCKLPDFILDISQYKYTPSTQYFNDLNYAKSLITKTGRNTWIWNATKTTPTASQWALYQSKMHEREDKGNLIYPMFKMNGDQLVLDKNNQIIIDYYFKLPDVIEVTAEQENQLKIKYPQYFDYSVKNKFNVFRLYSIGNAKFEYKKYVSGIVITEESHKWTWKDLGEVLTGQKFLQVAVLAAIKELNLFRFATRFIAASFPWEMVKGNPVGITQQEHKGWQENQINVIKAFNKLGGEYLTLREAAFTELGKERKDLINYLKNQKNYNYYRFYDLWAGKPSAGMILRGVSELGIEPITTAAIIAASSSIVLALISTYGGPKALQIADVIKNLEEPCKTTIIKALSGKIPEKTITSDVGAEGSLPNPEYAKYQACWITFAGMLTSAGITPPKGPEEMTQGDGILPPNQPSFGSSITTFIEENKLLTLGLVGVGAYLFVPSVKNAVDGLFTSKKTKPLGSIKKKVKLKDLGKIKKESFIKLN